MKKRTRAMLRQQFEHGKMPTEDDFGDLIESMLNMLDEGFEKSATEGFKVAQLGDGKLLSFYQNTVEGTSLWSMGLDVGTNNLSFQAEKNRPLLTLASHVDDDGVTHSRVGIRQSTPRHELDVGGFIASRGRVGREGKMAVPADGNWYDISVAMTGCQAWEVVAGVGGKDAEGRYALMHAFAMNAFNANPHITYHQTHFGNKCSRIELRWIGTDSNSPFEFKLQMRVGCTFGNEVWIKYHMTQLWLDTQMLESDQKPKLAPRPLTQPAKAKK
ncbi:hypothetical protein [Undibacterium sp. Ji49W]|uniref:hypothetical protein n=1 Tax=Undibacterium sp. Ji49W TaxID=3413040 RepID=UPI003BF1085C